jgi:hypothetical protein
VDKCHLIRIAIIAIATSNLTIVGSRICLFDLSSHQNQLCYTTAGSFDDINTNKAPQQYTNDVGTTTIDRKEGKIDMKHNRQQEMLLIKRLGLQQCPYSGFNTLVHLLNMDSSIHYICFD